MARPQVITAPDLVAGVRIEYVKARRVLRLSGHVIADGATIEIPLPQLLERLDARDAAPSGTSVRYLLFGALHRETKGGMADLVGVFGTEEAARRAFVKLRHQRPDAEGWAELARFNEDGNLRRVAWFGTGRPAPLDVVFTPAQAKASGPRPGRRRTRSRVWPWPGRRDRRP